MYSWHGIAVRQRNLEPDMCIVQLFLGLAVPQCTSNSSRIVHARLPELPQTDNKLLDGRLMRLTVAVPLLPVADNLEAANDLANREEAKHLCGHDTCAPVLCARCAAHLVEDGVGVERVGDRGRVAEGVERRLEVALDGLDGAGRVLVGV